MHRHLILVLALLLGSFTSCIFADGIEFTEEKLPNGMSVIYAPLRSSPVVHVRLLYLVGSRDERPDRQGFAHMFEHMMFRGSAHVKPEEHMKLVGVVGGYSNAFTSFDQTVYVNTIPANHLEMALYLEADRMASFKVSEEIYKIERNVVAKEWGMNYNNPYGIVFEDALKSLYSRHNYRWTPIGNMDHLKAAPVSELQEFFNKYYVPNNACLVIAGDIDIEAAKKLVHKFFAWIPAGPAVMRDVPAEPERTEPARVDIRRMVPIPGVGVAYHLPPYASDDNYALSLLATILGGGRSSRLHRALVDSDQPLCMVAAAQTVTLLDGGIFGAGGAVLPGKDVDIVEKTVLSIIDDVIKNGVTAQELETARTQHRLAIINGRKTAESIAEQLGDQKLFAGDASRVNTVLDKLAALTAADVQAIARKYLHPNRSMVVRVTPDLLGRLLGKRDTPKQANLENAPVAQSDKPVEPRPVTFPADYPGRAPMAAAAATPIFAKGVESTFHGVRVIVMPDHRLPLVSWSLVMRRGSDSDPPGKTGLGAITAPLVRRGFKCLSYADVNADLEARGISIEVSSADDHTDLSGSCPAEHLDHAFARCRQVLREPAMPAEEFDKIKSQTLAGLTADLADPATVARRELPLLVYGDNPLGRSATPQTINAITLDDARRHYESIFRPNDAMLIISGDVKVERGQELAGKLLADWPSADLPAVDYALPSAAGKRQILLVDNPEGKQSVIRLGLRAYDLHSDDKFAGAIAHSILSDGIESRLGRYLRAERGYSYGVSGRFSAGRRAGMFVGSTETAFETTAPAIEAMFKVFNDLRAAEPLEIEMTEAKSRTSGSMVMGTQTIEQQANRRVEGILNGYAIDYYDLYPQRLSQVQAAQVREVMRKYVDDGRFSIVVVAPADKVLDQLKALGEVRVTPMPAKRPAGKELIKTVP